jgi:hypothetical protein
LARGVVRSAARRAGRLCGGHRFTLRKSALRRVDSERTIYDEKISQHAGKTASKM